ncbi:hypothetical protein B0H14DRAFT_3906339 [Mycena olivaceomarginata]|nr:hypothetical protein B0H14DRAFT_3906339 [Mycena olivaceomarginata]
MLHSFQALKLPQNPPALKASSPQASKSQMSFPSASNSQVSRPGRTLLQPGAAEALVSRFHARVVPIGMGRFDNNLESDSSLLSPVFAHEPQGRCCERLPLRVLHRHTLPHSTFVDKLPVGTADLLPHSHPHSSPFAHHPHPADDADDPTPPALRHPPFLVHLCAPPCGLPLGALPYPEWCTGLLHRARRAGLGRIGRTVEWVLWNGNGSVEEGEWMSRDSRRQSPKTTSTDGYGSDDEDPDDGGAISDGNSNSSERGGGSVRNEKEWVGWMGDLRCQPRVAADEHIRVTIVTVYHCTTNICFTRDLGMCQS